MGRKSSITVNFDVEVLGNTRVVSPALSYIISLVEGWLEGRVGSEPYVL